MKNIYENLQKAEHSNLHRWLLNRTLKNSIRFNKPHGFKVFSIADSELKTFAPYCKKNFNHLKGIHACAIATVGELSAGLILMRHFSPKKYRLIMSKIEINYHYQAKKDIFAHAMISADTKAKMLEQLNTDNKLFHEIVTNIHDTDNAQIATVKSTWQIKSWDTVRTKV
ncbi:MAG: hypothetical protein A3F13_06085 [Gammaproteobacteria bacterium RIFCSPHIGHO2_12_FULL_40_19]|nr:MAG: hypothetical protein A3F13_06085 [Gammaproteobacteria bacterium RIFCSPHIGHO2_12_FULL_40_19]